MNQLAMDFAAKPRLPLKRSAYPVLAVLPRCPAEFTAWDALAHLGPLQQLNRVGSRLADLEQHGLVERTGQRRRGPAGAYVTVWRLTPQGHRAARERA